jgi:hypothetical protein
VKNFIAGMLVTSITLAAWAAFSEEGTPGKAFDSITEVPRGYLMSLALGSTPSRQTSIIQVDKDGYVICSTDRKPQ